ncbi:MAG: TlpA disulfide reductase family protein, partial [Flavitalea sp.]
AKHSTDPGISETMKPFYDILSARVVRVLTLKQVDIGIRRIDSIHSGPRADILKVLVRDSYDPEEMQAIMYRLLPTLKTDWCIEQLASQYSAVTQRVDAINRTLSQSNQSSKADKIANPAIRTDFGATLSSISNVSAVDFLKSLREHFPGKAIIFDRWATWCQPCVATLPHSAKLQKESKDLPVVFVYACTKLGSDEKKWKNQIADLKLPGQHFFIDEKLDSEISAMFNFTGYPGYAFINAAGEFKPGAFQSLLDLPDGKAVEMLLK